MILRKPYAFLIKHFKLIHLILAILSCYCIYRTKALLDFFNDYVTTMVNVIGQDLIPTLIPTFYKIVPILIIIVALIILVVMIVKKKPYLFYIINIIVYIFVFAIISYSNSTLAVMFRSLIDARTARLVRDFTMLAFFVQFITIPVIIIRTIGFDIKKFNFKEDLEELDISEEDREEFEVDITFDKNKLIRNIRKMKRFFLYSYKENMLLYNLVATGVVVGLTVTIYSSFYMKTPTVSQNTYFTGNGFSLSILDSYLVNTDYKGKIIEEDNYYLLVKIKVKSNINTQTLDTATTKITIGNYYYIPTLKYKDRFFDFGTIYQDEKIKKEYEEKILVYEIPKQLIDNEMIFSYVNKNSYNNKEGFKSTNVKINYKDLTGVNSNQHTTLGNQLEFTNSILNNHKIQITNYDIATKFKIEYNYCISNECISSSEYLLPKLDTNYDKTLLKLKGNLIYENQIEGIYDLYDFIESFGKICYNINGDFKIQNINSNQIVSKKTNDKDNIYIEVPKEIENATNISIVFTIRDRIYEYVLK